MKIRRLPNFSFRAKQLYLIERRTLAIFLFGIGFFISFFASFRPWFLWKIENTYMIMASLFIILSMLIDKYSSSPIYTNKRIIAPSILAFIFLLYQKVIGEASFSGFVGSFFLAYVFYATFKLDSSLLNRLTTIITKSLAVFLVISIATFILYLLGFPFSGENTLYGEDFYTFTNYRFFLIDDRALSMLIPRFQSVFLEPSHLGTVLAVLLQTQRGKWKKPYNIVLFIALLLTFSLGAYVYLVAIIFLNLWVNRKKILVKGLIVVGIIAATVVGSIFYNDGDNLLHNLIVLRMEIEDGELAGNNRTTLDFDKEFDSYLDSNDIWTGRILKDDVGNSGYKVFIYRNGIVGVLLLVGLVVTAFRNKNDRRTELAALIVATLIFGVDGFIMWYCRFVPMLATSKQQHQKAAEEKHPKP